MAVVIITGLIAVGMGIQTGNPILGAIYIGPFVLFLLAGCVYKTSFQRLAAVSIGALLPIIGYHMYFLSYLRFQKIRSTDFVNGLLIVVGLPVAIAICAALGATMSKDPARD